MSVRGSGRHEQGDTTGREPVRGDSRAVSGRGLGPSWTEGCAGISPGPGAYECRGTALRLCPQPRPAPRSAPRPAPPRAPTRPSPKGPGGATRRGGAGPGGAGRWALPRHGPTRGGPSAAPFCRSPPPGQTAAARRGAMAAGLGPWLLALALGPAGARRARRAARPGLGAARAAAPRAR